MDSLVPKSTTGENTDMIRRDKTTEDRRDLIEIKDEEDELELDWDSDYCYWTQKNIIETLIELIISNLGYCVTKSVNFLS